jgi:hypothetical protein
MGRLAMDRNPGESRDSIASQFPCVAMAWRTPHGGVAARRSRQSTSDFF